MSDTNTIRAIQIINKQDTVTYNVDKKIIDHFTNKPSDISHYIEILIPVTVALLTLVLTKLFDNWTENKKYKKELQKENRKLKIYHLKRLNSLKTAMGKSHFPDADYDDFLDWIADKMVGENPFEELKINSNIIFNGNREIIEHIDKLFNNAEIINLNFDWQNKGHHQDSYRIAKLIYDELNEVINKISKNLN